MSVRHYLLVFAAIVIDAFTRSLWGWGFAVIAVAGYFAGKLDAKVKK